MRSFGRTGWLAVLGLALLAAGCASVSERTNAYLGTPHYAPANADAVVILQSEPPGGKERLGEVILTVEGKPKREEIERKLREGAARLGADAVFVVHDKMHIFPVVYGDWWWGPMGVTEEGYRKIVGVAIKRK